MIIYEVNLCVDGDVAHTYRTWLDAHIRELLTIDGFLRATWTHRDVTDGDNVSQQHYTVSYEMRDRDAYERYLQEHAPRLRDEGISRFGGRFSATRRLHTVISRYPSEHP